MKKVTLVVAVALVLAMAVAGVYASDVRNTKHNLSMQGGKAYRSNNYGEICIFCHTPHMASTAPLWNRNYTPGAFTMYSSPFFKVTGSLDDTSKLCFSCHEAGNTYKTVTLVNSSNAEGTATFATGNISSAAQIGLNLRNDHPVGFNYATIQGTHSEINTASAVATSLNKTQAELFPGGMMTCSSCHDVHGSGSGASIVPTLLVRSNASSLLCLACHNK